MMNHFPKIVFTILHYCVPQETAACIESILSTVACENYDIVVVDNASPDSSGPLLRDKYAAFRNVHFLLNETNEGFARGNNAGYRYAREQLKADFLVMLNNDCIMTQKDFIRKLLQIYGRTPFHLLGPDIITPGGEHRNPHRMTNFSRRDINRIIRNRTMILLYLRLKRLLHIENKILLIEKWDEQRSRKERGAVIRNLPQQNVVLQGSCLIFSPDYLRQEKEALCPDTFMWLEEEILFYMCMQKDYVIRYSPEIQILHSEEASTKRSWDSFGRYLFFSEQLRNSAVVFRNIMDCCESGEKKR